MDGYRVANEIAKEVPDSLIINICDREGDVYEYFLEFVLPDLFLKIKRFG